MVDMIGGLPYRDELDYGRGLEAMDILLDRPKSLGIMCHVHVDQFNNPSEKETEQLCDKTIEHGMEGPSCGYPRDFHWLTFKEYRYKLYEKMRKAKMMMIACPMAWIDSNRKEDLMPFHNALTPAVK